LRTKGRSDPNGDHSLKGSLEGFRECHAGGDLLLMYELRDDRVIFVRAGMHVDLFD